MMDNEGRREIITFEIGRKTCLLKNQKEGI